MNLFHVEYTISAVVAAEDEAHAFEVALDERRDVLYDAHKPAISVGHEITSAADLRGEWDVGCLPYGGDGDTRIGAYLTENKEASK